MRKYIFWSVIFAAISCSAPKEISTSQPKEKPAARIPEPPVYRAAYTMYNDLVHTKLEIKFDWANKQLNGKASITLHPHFYPTDSVVLNARGMDLHDVSLLKSDGTKLKLQYTYEDKSSIHIKLDRSYKSDEHYTVFIDYTSNPEELPAGGSRAIKKDKGLYFINADGSNPEKPRQVWTQGETESNSAWFPTIEDPQQKMTQEIYITVDSSMTTVSNGLLISSVNNHDGTKTDYWKQSLPAAPYLTMIAASDFGVVKDKWKNIEVNYYLDKDYMKYAKMIFGHTPEMIDHFSKLLGVEYPWEKFAQVVVYEYVSGAMENTTAVIHGVNMQQDSSDYVDGNYEDYISHELFHHWFGDLVTCESWSNITLNESFANYAEYLWREYKFGRDDADRLNQGDQAIYLLVTKSNDPDLVRFDYNDREDVYDAISYNKGGRILHMLRKYVGDDAFFASLKLYLESHQFGAAEVHDLRLAFERVTGEDLNWFFNEWYFNHGHPNLEINYDWNDSTKTETVTVEQKQDFEKNPLFKIPLRADVYHDGIVDHKNITLTHAKEVFEWKYNSKPDLVNMDGERMLLCDKKDNKSKENLVFQFYHAPLYMDRFESLNKTGSDYTENSDAGKMMEDGLHDRYYNIRNQALKNIGNELKANKEKLKPVIINLAVHDSAASVRLQAIKALGKYLNDDAEVKAVIENGLNDISYNVQAASFKLIADNDSAKALKLAKRLEQSNGSDVINAVANVYKENPKEEYNDFFLGGMDRMRGYSRGTLAEIYGKYLKKVNDKTRETGIDKLIECAGRTTGYGKKLIVTTLEGLAKDMSDKITDANAKADELKKNNGGQNEIDLAKREADDLTKKQNDLNDRIKKLDDKKTSSN